MNKYFTEIMETFENDDIKAFAEKCLDNAPDYWNHVPASSTGKYHPRYALGEGGLARHTAALVRILNHILNIECFRDQFSSRQRDLLRVAGIAHDMMKSGTQEEFERSKWTRFDHPLRAAEFVRCLDGLPEEEKLFISDAIESHMGQWNTDKSSNVVLPKPETKGQIILHLSDYLASRKDIELAFEYDPSASEHSEDTVSEVDIKEFQINFGKYKGLTWPEIESEDPGYLDWGKSKDGFAFDVLRRYLKEKAS
jgi:hypothetical protein